MLKFTLTLLILFLTTIASAVELKGVSFPDQMQVGGKTLQLNGLGVRHKTIFRVSVYVAALYAEKKSQDGSAVIGSPDIKRVELAFVHSAPADKIRDSWDEALQTNCGSGCEAFKPAVEELKSKMVDLEVGDRMAFDIYNDHVDVWVKGKQVDSLKKEGFPQQFLKTWLGDHPVEDELKDGMLGKKQS